MFSTVNPNKWYNNKYYICFLEVFAVANYESELEILKFKKVETWFVSNFWIFRSDS